MGCCWRKTRRTKPRGKKAATPFHAVLNLINSVLGAGVLGIPYAFAKAGIIPSIGIFVMMLILNYSSLSIVCYISDATLVYSYGDLAGRILGPPFVIFVGTTTFLHCFGLLWSYSVLSGDFLISFLRAVGVSHDSIVQERWFLTVLVSLLVLQPLSWFSRVDSLSGVSTIAIFCILWAIIVIVINMIARFLDPDIEIDSPEWVHKSLSLVQCFSTLCFAFACQQNTPIIQSELKRKSASTMRKVCLVAIILCGLIYVIAGFCGYLQFTSEFFDAEDGGNVLTLYDDDNYLALSARLGALFVVVCSYPIILIPARGALFNVIRAILDIRNHRKKEAEEAKEAQRMGLPIPPKMPVTYLYAELKEAPPLYPAEWGARRVFNCFGGITRGGLITGATGTCIVLLTMLLSIWLNNVSFVFDLIGSTATSAVCFVIPCVIYIRICTRPAAYVNKNRKEVLEADVEEEDAPEPEWGYEDEEEGHGWGGGIQDNETRINTKWSSNPIKYVSASSFARYHTFDNPEIEEMQSEGATGSKTDSAPDYDTQLEALLKPRTMKHPTMIGACIIIWAGIIFGLVALASAIIYDTDIHTTYNIS